MLTIMGASHTVAVPETAYAPKKAPVWSGGVRRVSRVRLQPNPAHAPDPAGPDRGLLRGVRRLRHGDGVAGAHDGQHRHADVPQSARGLRHDRHPALRRLRRPALHPQGQPRLRDLTSRMDGVPVDDRGLLLADGLFETILARHGELVLFDAHLARMTRGCAVLGLPAPDAAEARRLCGEV